MIKYRALILCKMFAIHTDILLEMVAKNERFEPLF